MMYAYIGSGEVSRRSAQSIPTRATNLLNHEASHGVHNKDDGVL
jgi:hypothetical protein